MSDMGTSPLATARLYAILAAEDSERARVFWRDTVGLAVKDYPDQPGYFSAYAGDGTELLVYQRDRSKAEHTVAGFHVPDIHAAVAALRRRGVVFEEYDFPTLKTVDGVADNGIVWSAWFRDTEGNIIGITQEK
jgi:predicted enzyme related to lactoylglutathione lyase